MSSRYLFLLAFGLFALTASAQDGQIVQPYKQFTLENGLNVILHRDASTPLVSTNLWYHVGSAYEKPGRTGFAHLFEHLMFEGSKHVPEGKIDEWFEAVGGSPNGSTTNDRTNYMQTFARNGLERALFIESDRMGYLLDAITPEKVDGQRDVVKNERRQSYENRPYGLAWQTIGENLYPPNFPYHWPVIGSMEDLSAATYEDVVDFFKKYYTPNNASLVIAGDIDLETTPALVEKWFAEIPAGPKVEPLYAPTPSLDAEKRIVMEDRVQLPRLYMAWITPPAFAPGNPAADVAAEIFAGGKNARLYERLVYDLQIAQDVFAFQNSKKLASEFFIVATARRGHTLEELRAVIDEEVARLATEAPSTREMSRVVNQNETAFLERLELLGQKADQFNAYFYYTRNPDYFNEDLSALKALSPNDVSAFVSAYLRPDRRVVLSVVPEGAAALAVPDSRPAAETTPPGD